MTTGDKNSPKICISVLIPSLNSGEYIQECLSSVIRQTLEDIEILCIDAGSTDGTIEAIEKFASEDKRIRIIHVGKKSYGWQLNAGVSQARGEYIGIVETDDYIDESMYCHLYSYVLEKQYPDFVKGGFFQFADIGGKRAFSESCRLHLAPLFNQRIDLTQSRELGTVDVNHIWSGIYRRRFLLDKKIKFNETPGASYQDTSFSMLVGLLAGTGVYIRESFYFYRIDNKESSVKSSTKWRCVIDEFEYLAQELRKRGNKAEELKKYVWLNKLSSYFWNVTRLPQREREEFLSEIQQELEEYMAEGAVSGYFDDEKKRLLDFLTDRDVLDGHMAKRRKLKEEYRRFVMLAKAGEKFVLVSAGRVGKTILQNQEMVGRNYIEAIADNDAGKQGREWNHYKILSVLDAVQKYRQDYFVVANRYYAEEIQKQLEGAGVGQKNILVLDGSLSVEEFVSVLICERKSS